MNADKTLRNIKLICVYLYSSVVKKFLIVQHCASVVILILQLNCISTQESEVRAKEELAANTSDLQNDSVKVKKLLSEGNELYNKDRFDEAVDKIKKANSIKPTEDGYYLLALSYIKLQSPERAREVIGLGLGLNPKNEKLLATNAIVLTALGDEENAVNTYNTLSKSYPANQIYSFKYGVGLKSLLRYEDSYSVLTKIDEENFPLKPQLYLHLGDICYELKRFSHSLEYYSKAKLSDPSLDITELKSKTKLAEAKNKGDEFFKNKNYFEAIRYYTLALELKPESASILSKLGEAYFLNNQIEKAEDFFKKSLKLESKNKEAYLSLSSIYSKKGNLQKSTSILQDAVKIYGEDSDLYYNLGLIYKKIGNTKLALVSFIDSKYKNPNHLLTRNALAQTFLDENFMLEARNELEDLNEINPKDEKVRKTIISLNRLGENKKVSKKKVDSRKNEIQGVEKKVEIENKFRIINSFDSYISSGQKEKCLVFLKKEWKEGVSAGNIDNLETVASLFAKLGHSNLALESFEFILERKPESFISYYQIGLLKLSKDRLGSLQNFEKAIAIKRNEPSFYIARGINYYKLGKRQRARDDFHYALSIESNLEIASYNLGMILYNDHLYNDAESIFLDLTKKYPNFADPYYHLSYIYFEQGKLEEAERYIVSSLNLDRNPTSIYAYIKILEKIKKANSNRTDIDSLSQSLKREIVEKYPDSTYTSKVAESVLSNNENRVLIQNYPLSDIIVSSPIFVNGTILLNYGNSIARLSSDTKNILWRRESNYPYQSLQVGTRLYGISKTHIDQIDLETGKNIWRIQSDSTLTGKLEVGESIVFSGIQNEKEIIYSYSFEGELQSKILLEKGSKWSVTKNGNLFVFRNTVEGMDWEIFDIKLNQRLQSLTLLGRDLGETIILGAGDLDCYLQKGKQVYKFEANGNFSRSPRLEDGPIEFFIKNNTLYLNRGKATYYFPPNMSKLEKIESPNYQSETLLNDGIYLSANGILTKKDSSGKTIWSENLSEKSGKSKFAVFSVLLR